MKKEEFISLVKNPETLSEVDYTQFSELINQYPLFSLARIFEIISSGNKGAKDFDKILRKNSSNIGNLKLVFLLMKTNRKSDTSTSGEPPASAKIKETPEIIGEESFSITGNSSDEVLLSFDYRNEGKMTSIENDEGQIKPSSVSQFTNSRKYELIDKFIENNPGSIRSDASSVSSEVPIYDTKEDDNLITHTLAGIYVRQGLFSKAIYAYEKLILKYPEKSVYFASQIEEIKKLINK